MSCEVNSLVLRRSSNHLIDIGGCSLHIISNVVKNSLPNLYIYDELEELLQDIPTFFNYHPQFSEQFQHVQEIFNLEKHQLLRFIEVRFLSIYPVVNRVIEQHKAVKKMFVEEIPNNHRNVAKQPRALRIRTALKNKYTLPSLYFIRNTLEMFQKYEKLFQKSEVTIHLLYDKQIELYQTALMYLCPVDKIQNLVC